MGKTGLRCVDSCAVSSPRSLRPAFAAAAIREAEHWWLGDAAEFRAIIEGATAPSYGGAWRDRKVFSDFTTAPPDHARFVFQRTIEGGKATLWYGASGACRIIGDLRTGTANRGVIHHHGHCYEGWWTLDGTRTVPPQPIPKRRRGPGPLRHHHPARKHRDPERARARARAVAAARPHHRKNLSPREIAAAIADEVGRNGQKT